MSGIANAAGFTGLSGSGDTSLYIVPNRHPTLLRKLYPKTVARSLFSFNCESALKGKGASVTIPQRATVTVSDYNLGDVFTFPSLTPGAAKELKIDQAHKWEFGVQSLEEIQSYIKNFKTEWIDDATKNTATKLDTNVLNAMPALCGATSVNFDMGTLAAPLHLTPDKDYKDAATGVQFLNATQFISNCVTVLGENNVDTDEWKVNVTGPKFLANKIANSDLRAANITGDGTGIIRKGQGHLGQVQGADIITSNLFTPVKGGANGDVNVYPVIYGCAECAEMAIQYQDTWAGKLPYTVGWGFYGVMVYGYTVTIPAGYGVAYVTTENKL